MKRNWKSLLVLMTAMLCAVLLTVAAAAEGEIVDSGECGDNLTWTFYRDDGLFGSLVITGTGQMQDYDESNQVPWKSYSSSIHTLVLDEGITHIGNNAFYQIGSMIGDLIIPNSVESIGDYAFYNCYGIKGSLKLSDSLKTIGKYAFFNCKFTGELIIPDCVEDIDEYAFSKCDGFDGNLIIGSGTKTIGKYAFQYSGNEAFEAS